MSASLLFEPFDLRGLRLRNRIVMAPMTRSRAVGRGMPSDMHPVYYEQRASAGLIIAEATQVSVEAQGYVRTPGIYTDEQVAAWRGVVDRVHAAGGAIFLQLWHVGRIGHPSNRFTDKPLVGPSAIAAEGPVFTEAGMAPLPRPHALTIPEIGGIVADFAHAAANARRAGFDGVEIHAANGYLIDAFLHDNANRRTDCYGGSFENRTRLLVEIVQEVGAAIEGRRVGVRLSPFGVFNDVRDTNPETLFDHVVRTLDTLDIAYLHIINPEVSGDRAARTPTAQENLPRFVRERFRGCIIAAGGYDRVSATRGLASGDVDLVAFGRPFIANPDLPKRLAKGLDLAGGDRKTFYTDGAEGYIDYPSLERIA